MGMKKFTLLLLFSCGFCFSQNESNLKVYESPEYKDEIRIDSINSIYTGKNGKTGVVRNNDREIFFDLFTEKLKLLTSLSVELDKKEYYIGDIFYNNEIKVFTETFPKKDEKILTCYTFNFENSRQNKIVLSTSKIDKKLSLYSNEKGAGFAMSSTDDFFSIASYTIHRDEIYIHLSLFNSNTFEFIYDKQVSRKESAFYTLKDVYADENKNVFVLGESFYDEEAAKSIIEKNRHFILDKFTKENHSNLTIQLEENYLKSVKPRIIGNNYNLYGFYSESGLDAIKGVCNIEIDIADFKIINKNLQDLPKQVYTDLFGIDKFEEKKGEELLNFEINYILEDTNNNVYLAAEEFYLSNNGRFGPSRNKQERYDDILLIKFNPNGTLEWGRSIFKRDYNPSYNVFLKNDKLHVLLNSGKDLRDLDDGRTKTSKGIFETSALYDFVYDPEGNLNINKIQNNKGNTYYLPNYGTYVNGKFIMISDSKRNRRFMSLE